MKTKIILTVNDISHELAPDCIKNWDEVVCTYKRTDLSGVVRSFSSGFEFVNDAHDMLLGAYLKYGVKASGSVALYVLNNDWSWRKEFEAPLNFSTVNWDSHILSINCIDDGLATLIKSRKGTKYEFEVGKDVEVDGILDYRRITLHNSCAHEIMGESNADNGAVLIGNASSLKRLPTYNISSETFENSPILYEDQSTNKGDAFITSKRDVNDMKLRIEIWSNAEGYKLSSAELIDIHLMRFNGDDDNMIDCGSVYRYEGKIISGGPFAVKWGFRDRKCAGIYRSLDALRRAHPSPDANIYAIISPSGVIAGAEAVYFTPVSNDPNLVQWEKGDIMKYRQPGSSEIVSVYCINVKYVMEFDYSTLPQGQKFALFYQAKLHRNNTADKFSDCYFPIFSKITTRWASRAVPISIDAINPRSLLYSLVSIIGGEKYNIVPEISDHDPRLGKTYLLAAESVRGIPGAKIYTTFDDFCGWMEAVFGYVYTIGEPIPPMYSGIMKFSSIEDDWHFEAGGVHGVVVDGYCPDGHHDERPIFIRSHGCFCVFETSETGNVYTRWKDSLKYNTADGKARRDLIFDDGRCYYIVGQDGDLIEFRDDAKAASRVTQSINFVHRSELFQDNAPCIEIAHASSLQSKIDTSMLYSCVEVGYEKQEYSTECGRDEWNFTNYYTTGIDVIEKTLTLKSKYRADCYGLEFLAQQRAKDMTDNKSDNTVFFVHCCITQHDEVEDVLSDSEESRGGEETAVITTTKLTIDRSVKIKGALTDDAFNGEYSPYYCIKANEGYISSMAPDMTLQFASSDGNSDIIVDGIRTTDDIPLGNRLFSEVEVSFTASDIDLETDYSNLIKVAKDGLVYTGFLKETQYCYARPTEVEYSLIVKSMEPI